MRLSDRSMATAIVGCLVALMVAAAAVVSAQSTSEPARPPAAYGGSSTDMTVRDYVLRSRAEETDGRALEWHLRLPRAYVHAYTGPSPSGQYASIALGLVLPDMAPFSTSRAAVGEVTRDRPLDPATEATLAELSTRSIDVSLVGNPLAIDRSSRIKKLIEESCIEGPAAANALRETTRRERNASPFCGDIDRNPRFGSRRYVGKADGHDYGVTIDCSPAVPRCVAITSWQGWSIRIYFDRSQLERWPYLYEKFADHLRNHTVRIDVVNQGTSR